MNYRWSRDGKTLAMSRGTYSADVVLIASDDTAGRNPLRPILLSALLLAFVARSATAQEQRGAIEGTVQDAQHAVLPGAGIAALNLAQGTAISTTADASGTFRFPALAPGYYDVTASLAGFTAVKFERVEVLLGQIKRLSFVLEIAAVSRNGPRLGVLTARGHAPERARVQPPAGHDRSCCRRAAISPRLVSAGTGRQPGAEARRHLHRRLERVGEPLHHQRHRDHGPDQRVVGSQTSCRSSSTRSR